MFEFTAHCMDCAKFGKSCTENDRNRTPGSCFKSKSHEERVKAGKGTITKEELWIITNWLRVNIWRNDDVMYDDEKSELADIITSLHNLLHEAITGKRYDYAFHWCNKIGADCIDNFFDNMIMKEGENHDEK